MVAGDDLKRLRAMLALRQRCTAADVLEAVSALKASLAAAENERLARMGLGHYGIEGNR